MAGPQISKLMAAAQSFWEIVEGWLALPLSKWDPLSCHEDILYLMAWQRDLNRFADEPLALFRLRVSYAFANAKDGGDIGGFSRIFGRLGLVILSINERVDGQDLDIVYIEIDSEVVADNFDLLQHIIRHYGRTCRRYVLQSGSHTVIHARAGEFSADYTTTSAKMNEPDPLGIAYARAGEMNCDYLTVGASV